MNFTPASLLIGVANAPQSPDQQLLDIDQTLFIQLGLFVVLALLMNQLLWKPYLRVRAERVSRGQGYRDEAARMEKDAETRLVRVDKELAEARRQGSGELALARAEAQAREQTLIAEAQASAQVALADARAKLDAALAGQRATLESRASSLGREAAERVLGRPVVS